MPVVRYDGLRPDHPGNQPEHRAAVELQRAGPQQRPAIPCVGHAAGISLSKPAPPPQDWSAVASAVDDRPRAPTPFRHRSGGTSMSVPVRLETSADGVATVWFDASDRPVNTLSMAAWAALDRTLDEVDRARPIGVVFASARPRGFIAGADLLEIQAMTDEQLDASLARGQQILDRIASLPVPTVAAIDGDALGGGFELALACRSRVAADDPATRLGLPETTLGLLPAWGGLSRLPALIGVPEALKLLVSGKTVSPSEAVALGMIDAAVPRDRLMEEARGLAAGRPPALPPRAADAAGNRREADDAEALGRLLDKLRDDVRARSGDNLPAPLRLIDAFERSWGAAPETAAREARRVLIELRGTEAGRNLLRLFFLRTAAKRMAAEAAAGRPRQVRSAVVVGGGTMGAGIAQALARAGLDVQVVEADDRTAAAATARIAALTGDDSIRATTDWSAVAGADLVVEAVVERLPVKIDVFRRLDGLASPDAILASNTSSLGIAEIAAATRHPRRVIGLHFFNPVPKMPLVEIVRTPLTDADSLATGVAVVAGAGKTPVIVNDSPGFLVNRVLFPYLHEALGLFAEGARVAAVDTAIRSWGMPMGPFALIDEIGLDVTRMILDSLERTLGPRLAAPRFLETAIARGWLGRKAGRGFYLHPAVGKATPNPEMASLVGDPPPLDASPADLQRRLIEPMAAEARMALAEGVVEAADAIDLATVLGLGFAPFRGGLASYAGLVQHPVRG
ncbi:MAG: FAD-dependent oxidoreductase [Planctomycetia bacterium]|nr:FAD-dependent oxidoreductase [Planctomycetia bacterium]